MRFNDKVKTEQRFREHWNKFTEYQQMRDKPLIFFQNRSLLEYVKDSVKRMNEYSPKPSHKEPWQNNVFDPITRNKLITILSKIASSRMKPELIVKSKSIFEVKAASERKQVFSNLLDAANRKNNDAKQLIWEMYSAMSEGTVIGYEDWKMDTRNVRYVKEYDAETGKTEYEDITYDAWDDVFGEIVPIKEFYPETVWVGSIDEVKRCFRIKEMKLEAFKDSFSKFKNASNVKAASYFYGENELIEWGISNDVDGDNVQIMQYYDEVKGILGMWANGLEIYYGPLPWNHNKIPFWLSQFEIIHPQYLFGKSLPDKMKGMQDINNGLFNSMLDQVLIGLNSPLFIDGNIDDLGDDYLEPGKMYSIEQGAKVQRAAMGSVDPTAHNMLQLVKRSIDESSVSAQAQGIATGGRKTRYEVELLNEGALNLAGLFLQIMEGCISRKYLLRMYNILQFYSQPSSVESGKAKFKFITIDNVKLSNGKTGKRMIQIVGSETDIPNKDELMKLASEESGGESDILESKVQPVAITRDWLMNKEFELEIEIVANSSVKESESQKRRNDVTFYQMTAKDPDFDQEIIKRNLARAFDQDQDVVKIQEQAQGIPGMDGQQQPQQQQQEGPDLSKIDTQLL